MGYSIRALRLRMACLLGLLIGGATGSPAQEPPPPLPSTTPPRATNFLPDGEKYPTGEEGSPLPDLAPVTIAETDDVLTRLRKEQFNAALEERQLMRRIIEVGEFSFYDVYFDNARRIRDAELDLAADGPARVAARRRYLGEMILAERREMGVWKSGGPSDYDAARVRRLQAQIDLCHEDIPVPRRAASGSPQAVPASPVANPVTLLDLKPIEARAEDPPLRRLQIERRNAALEAFRLLNKFVFENENLTLVQLHELAERLVVSSQDLAESDEERMAPLEAWVAYMKKLEAMHKVRVEHGATTRFVLAHARFARIRAEIRLHHARTGGGNTAANSPLPGPPHAAVVGSPLEALPDELSSFLGLLQRSGNETTRSIELMTWRWVAAAKSLERSYWELLKFDASPPYLIESVHLAFDARLEIAGSPADRAYVHERHVALARHLEEFYQKRSADGSVSRIHPLLATEYRANAEIRQILEIPRTPEKE